MTIQDSKEVLACDIRTSPNMHKVNACIDQLLINLPSNTNAILHSNQGILYQLPDYQKRLSQNSLTRSMSRKGNCLDNVPMESFFSLAKREFVWHHVFNSVEDFVQRFSRYISRFNNIRIARKSEGLTPIKIRNPALTL